MHVLVTGAAGFIGSHVAEDLLKHGHRVTGLDDLSSGSLDNLPDAERPGWAFVEGDVRDAALCARLAPEAIVHLAARNSVQRSLTDPAGAVDVNILGGVSLLEAARAAGTRRVVFASSSSVYGAQPAECQHEGCATRPNSPYAASKVCMETLAATWSEAWGIHTLGLRFFNVFGPRQSAIGPYAPVVPRFVTAALAGLRPVVYGDGLQVRDFTYVDNAVLACRLALRAPAQASGRSINVAAGAGVSVLDLWRLVAGACGVGVEPRHEPARPGDLRHSRADVGAARLLLGYLPPVAVAQGVEATVQWHMAKRAERSVAGGLGVGSGPTLGTDEGHAQPLASAQDQPAQTGDSPPRIEARARS